jgi:hypothetical protein
MGIADRISKLARSPQGRKAVEEAKRMARDPETRKKLDDTRRRLTQRGKRPQ